MIGLFGHRLASTSPAATVPSRMTIARSQRPRSSGSSDVMTTMPTPDRASSRAATVDFRFCANVDTARRFVHQDHFGIDRQLLWQWPPFCWLPPESDETGDVDTAHPNIKMAAPRSWA